MYSLVLALVITTPAETKKQWWPVVEAAAEHYKLDPLLLGAIIQTESNWNPDAVSHVGAIGLCQLMPKTAKELGVNDPYDPGQNIWGMALYIRQLDDRFNNWYKTLAAYNAGPHRVKRCDCIPEIEETQLYVRKVIVKWLGVEQ